MKLKTLRKITLIFSIISITTFFATQILQKDTDFIYTKYSDYIFGEYGYIVPITLTSFIISQLIIAYSLRKKQKEIALTIFVASLGGIIAILFPTTYVKDINFQRTMHTIGAATNFLLLPLAISMYVKKYKNDAFSKVYKSIANVSFLLFATMSILTILNYFIKISFFGIVEKIDIMILQIFILIWACRKSTSR